MNHELIICIVLNPQDILVALQLTLAPSGRGLALDVAEVLGLSPAEVHYSFKRLIACKLVRNARDGALPTVNKRHLSELLIHGVRYVYPAAPAELTRGVPTAHGAPPLARELLSDDPPPVWPHPRGVVKGFAVAPLYKSAPDAALRNPKLYELLALTDALRLGGRASARSPPTC